MIVAKGSHFTMQIYVDPDNKRLRVDDYRGNKQQIIERIHQLASEHPCSKVFVKARAEDWQTFLAHGFLLEGIFKGYFHGSDAYSMAYYYDQERRTSNYALQEDQILQQILELPANWQQPPLPSTFNMRQGTLSDCNQLAELYGTVFEVYPTPMNDAAYIKKVMKEGTLFYVIESNKQIISACSAEINLDYHNAEMTDCATLPDFRKHGLMKHLLIALEKKLLQREIYCLYSLSRALSFGMNRAFYQLGYQYTGRLVKNCLIFDKYEDMNLWVKDVTS